MSRYRRIAKGKPTEWERRADARCDRWWLAFKWLVFLGAVLWVYAVITSPWYQGLAVWKVFAAERTTVTLPGFRVGDRFDEIKEPPIHVLIMIDGEETVRLQHLWLPGLSIEVPVEALKMVRPYATQTKLGLCSGKKALSIGLKGTRNRAFYKNPRIACAAFTAFCMRHCGRPGMSFSASAQYAQVRKRGGKLVASKVSARFAPYFKYFKLGDLLFFHKAGGRIGHVEYCVGNGWTVGTSSSVGRVGKRRIGNRGFAVMSVVRL